MWLAAFCHSFLPQTLLFFSGFLIRFDKIPAYWKWCAAAACHCLLLPAPLLRRACRRTCQVTPVVPGYTVCASPAGRRYAYIDVLRYAWGSLMKNQFNGDRDVDVSSLSHFFRVRSAMVSVQLAGHRTAIIMI